jgi:hypothetical protein
MNRLILYDQDAIGGGNTACNRDLYVDVRNVFDTDLPFFNDNTAHVLGDATNRSEFVSNLLCSPVSPGCRVS